MAAEKALALVVRGMDWSETSRITTLFSREFGKVRALAKGGRRLKSNFDCAFDLLSVCRIVFLRKAHGGLDLLTEARLEERACPGVERPSRVEPRRSRVGGGRAFRRGAIGARARGGRLPPEHGMRVWPVEPARSRQRLAVRSGPSSRDLAPLHRAPMT